MKKILDCFIFYNEVKLLEIRLKYLYEVVDFFVIIEANTTFNGNAKELNFKKYHEIFEPYKDKIIYVPIKMNDFKGAKISAWDRETYQRNYISTAVESLKLKQESFVLISDIDEIPLKETLEALKSENIQDIKSPSNASLYLKSILYLFKHLRYKFKSDNKDKYYLRLKFMYYIFVKKYSKPITLIMDYNCFYLNYNRSKRIWPGLQIVSSKWLDVFTIDQIRGLKNTPVATLKSGWHFTYLGGKEMIKNKIRNFSHQEFNVPEILSDKFIDSCIKNGYSLVDYYLKPDRVERSYVIKSIDYFPEDLKIIIENYPDLIISEEKLIADS